MPRWDIRVFENIFDPTGKFLKLYVFTSPGRIVENVCNVNAAYCMGQHIPNILKTIYQQVLKLGVNEASA
jgi:hypothetical protein